MSVLNQAGNLAANATFNWNGHSRLFSWRIPTFGLQRKPVVLAGGASVQELQP
ncbi:MAG: hypothetical protein ACYDC8_09825 [Gammaproteobacteria bacterium]